MNCGPKMLSQLGVAVSAVGRYPWRESGWARDIEPHRAHSAGWPRVTSLLPAVTLLMGLGFVAAADPQPDSHSAARVSDVASAKEPGPVLVIRGDDLGWSRDGVLAFAELYDAGVLQSASLMAPGQYFAEAVEMLRDRPGFAVGIHLTLLATNPLKPILPADQIPSLIAEDGFFYRGRDDLLAAGPRIEEIEAEWRAQIASVRATGLPLIYFDWHMAPAESYGRADIDQLIERLAAEEKCLVTQDIDGSRSGAQLLRVALEGWDTQRLADGTLAYSDRPTFPEELGSRYLATLRELPAGTWWHCIHPGSRSGQQRGVKQLYLSPEFRQAIAARGIQLSSYRPLWEQRSGAGAVRTP